MSGSSWEMAHVFAFGLACGALGGNRPPLAPHGLLAPGGSTFAPPARTNEPSPAEALLTFTPLQTHDRRKARGAYEKAEQQRRVLACVCVCACVCVYV
jgi:hypothetical protein